MSPSELDSQIRMAAFAFLDRHRRVRGDTIHYQQLLQGFEHQGERISLGGPPGIFKPRMLEIPLSIRTSPKGPYEDSFEAGDSLLYNYRGTDPRHPDNAGLKAAMREKFPLIYFFGIGEGDYVARYPAFIVGDDPRSHFFRVTLAKAVIELGTSGEVLEDLPEAPLERRYARVQALQRLHQDVFRERLLRAYRERCSVCQLGHKQLLDAAHILADKHPRGEASVTNGLLLCKLHHSAFEANFLGIRPDRVIEIHREILLEPDGPLLEGGLKNFHGRNLHDTRKPSERPDPSILEERYEKFRQVN